MYSLYGHYHTHTRILTSSEENQDVHYKQHITTFDVEHRCFALRV